MQAVNNESHESQVDPNILAIDTMFADCAPNTCFLVIDLITSTPTNHGFAPKTSGLRNQTATKQEDGLITST